MADRSGQLLGNYRLARLLGEGGFADVYLGEHLHLGTEAAIKVLHTHLVGDDWESFRKEARIIAGLIHPHIVRLLDFDVKEGMPFLVMAYAPNGTLRRRHSRGEPVPVAAVVSYISQVASALQYVHEHKLIHRDVKPENLLVGTDGEILLSDFGVAIIAQTSREPNIQGIGGTVAYMAPEQIQSKPGAASDQYALGVVVYEWLTGERPFTGSFTEMATKHILVEPPPLRERVPTLAPEVEAVVLRALAKNPARRFPSVQAFGLAFEEAAGAGQATLIGLKTPMPVVSAPPLTPRSSTEGTFPAATLGSSTANEASLSTRVQVSLLVPGSEVPLSVSSSTPVDPSAQTLYAPPAAPAKQSAPALLPQSAQRRLSRRAVLGGLVGLVGAAGGISWLLLSQRPTATGTVIPPTPTFTPTPLEATRLLTYRGHSTNVYAVAWSPDGTRIASGAGAQPTLDVDHTVQVWESAAGTPLLTYRGHTQSISGMDWSPDSKLIASASYDGTVQVWEANAGASPLVTYRGHKNHVWDVAWSPDGNFIASCGADGTVQVWKAATGSLVYTYRRHLKGVASVEWSRDGSQILSASYDTTVHIWDAFSGTLALKYTGHIDWVKSAVWSPDGTRVASGGGNNDLGLDKDNSVQIWDAKTGNLLVTYTGHPLPVFGIIWSPDGAHIASCGADNNVRVWNAANADTLFSYSHHTNLVESLSWSPDGTRVVSGSDDKTAQVWWAK
ncbi:MAG TPA: protein kinase [Ktedonobacterales bacterium]|jgi:serine/threonine protein kinase